LEGYINDYALGQTAIKLANESNLSDSQALQATGQTKQEIKDTGNLLIRRANAYPNLFDHQTGFFRGKDSSGN
jgi:putative alpha-1,2-mannosidase